MTSPARTVSRTGKEPHIISFPCFHFALFIHRHPFVISELVYFATIVLFGLRPCSQRRMLLSGLLTLLVTTFQPFVATSLSFSPPSLVLRL